MRALCVALVLGATLAAGCDASSTEPARVAVGATYELRTEAGAFEPLAELEAEAAVLDLAEAWTVELGDVEPYVAVDVDLGDPPHTDLPFVFSVERCPSGRRSYDFVVFPAPGIPDPRAGDGAPASPRTTARTPGCALSVFAIEGLGGRPGLVSLYDERGGLPLGDPIAVAAPAEYTVAGVPGLTFQDGGASWPAPGGRSALSACYRLEQGPADAREIDLLVVSRPANGFWSVRAADGCSTSQFNGAGFTAYLFPLDVSALASDPE